MQRNKISFKGQRVFIGIDVHKKYGFYYLKTYGILKKVIGLQLLNSIIEH